MKVIKYIARELNEKPFLAFQSIEFEIDDEIDNPLVLDNIPAYQYGVCTLKIVFGELVERTSGEMKVFQDEYELTEKFRQQQADERSLVNSTFIYDSQVFPMNSSARIYYNAIAATNTASDYNVLQVDGAIYTLVTANVNAFTTAFNEKLIELLNPVKVI